MRKTEGPVGGGGEQEWTFAPPLLENFPKNFLYVGGGGSFIPHGGFFLYVGDFLCDFYVGGFFSLVSIYKYFQSCLHLQIFLRELMTHNLG